MRQTAVPFDKLIVANGDIDLKNMDYLDAVTVTGTGAFKIIVSGDSGSTWKTWNNGWNDIILDTSNIVTNGMSLATINAITKTDWTTIIDPNKTIRFAYCLSIDTTSTAQNTDKIAITVDMKGEWGQAKEADSWTTFPDSKTLRVRLYSSGDFKINY